MNAPSDVVGRTATTLRAVADSEPTGATTTELAGSVGLARPTVHRLLVQLQGHGLVDRVESRWVLGPELFLLGNSASARFDVTALAQPIVRQLAVATGESAFFSQVRGEETVCLLREDGSFPLRSHVLHVGIRFPLGVATAGMAVLAYLPEHEVDDYLSRADLVTRHGEQHSAAAVRARIASTRAQGWVLNPGLLVAGSWGMGAAVFDGAGRPAWALSLTGVEQRFGPDRQPELGDLLLRAAHELGARIDRSRGQPA